MVKLRPECARRRRDTIIYQQMRSLNSPSIGGADREWGGGEWETQAVQLTARGKGGL